MMDSTLSTTNDARNALPTTIGVANHADHPDNASQASSGTTPRTAVSTRTRTVRSTSTGMEPTAAATRDTSISMECVSSAHTAPYLTERAAHQARQAHNAEIPTATSMALPACACQGIGNWRAAVSHALPITSGTVCAAPRGQALPCHFRTNLGTPLRCPSNLNDRAQLSYYHHYLAY